MLAQLNEKTRGFWGRGQDDSRSLMAAPHPPLAPQAGVAWPWHKVGFSRNHNRLLRTPTASEVGSEGGMCG